MARMKDEYERLLALEYSQHNKARFYAYRNAISPEFNNLKGAVQEAENKRVLEAGREIGLFPKPLSDRKVVTRNQKKE